VVTGLLIVEIGITARCLSGILIRLMLPNFGNHPSQLLPKAAGSR